MQRQKILIVDDDENIAELISLYLTKECFETKMVYDGKEALEAFASFQPRFDFTRCYASKYGWKRSL